jgi:YegS/Rv2252/BmrU family lipid kinase
LFLLNPISGIGKKGDLPSLIKRHLSEHKYELRYTEYRKHGEEIAHSEKSNFDAIIAIGGDGTVNEIASALANSQCALGIIPAGSGNGLARHLKIPLNTKSAIERINNFKPQIYDSGTVNQNFFAGTCGFGFDGYIAECFDKYPKRGFLSYAKLIASEYGKYEPKHFIITTKAGKIEQKALICAVANSSQFGNGFTISPSSDMQDGKMELILITKFPFIGTMAVGTRFFTQSIHKSKYFKSIEITDAIQIECVNTDESFYHLDGEPYKTIGPFEIKINPQNLLIL